MSGKGGRWASYQTDLKKEKRIEIGATRYEKEKKGGEEGGKREYIPLSPYRRGGERNAWKEKSLGFVLVQSVEERGDNQLPTLILRGDKERGGGESQPASTSLLLMLLRGKGGKGTFSCQSTFIEEMKKKRRRKERGKAALHGAFAYTPAHASEKRKKGGRGSSTYSVGERSVKEGDLRLALFISCR